MQKFKSEIMYFDVFGLDIWCSLFWENVVLLKSSVLCSNKWRWYPTFLSISVIESLASPYLLFSHILLWFFFFFSNANISKKSEKF